MARLCRLSLREAMIAPGWRSSDQSGGLLLREQVLTVGQDKVSVSQATQTYERQSIPPKGGPGRLVHETDIWAISRDTYLVQQGSVLPG